jgi:hypothetical protein
MSDPLRETIVAGAHEGSNLNKTNNGGNTWTNITAGTSGWTQYPVVVNAQTYFFGSQNGGGIQRTTDGGGNWTKVCSTNPFWNPLITSKGVIYFQALGNSALLKSTDQGVTWISMPKPGDGSAYDNFYTPIEMPDGSIVATGPSNLVRCNDGKTWATLAGSTLPNVGGNTKGCIGYNRVTKAFFMAFFNCNSTIPSNAIWRLGYNGTDAIDRAIDRYVSGSTFLAEGIASGGMFIKAYVSGTVQICNPAGILIQQFPMRAGSLRRVNSFSLNRLFVVKFSSSNEVRTLKVMLQ